MASDSDFASAAVNQSLSVAEKLHLYCEMARSRAFEQQAINDYVGGNIGGWLLLQIGQEAIAVAVRSLMGPFDHSICGMRGIGHALAAGMTMRSAMAELFGKATGAAKGKGGMLGFYCPEQRHWGNHGLAGTQTALATGLAFGLKHRNEPGMACCFLGDGAMNQGVVHEAFNLAALFRLPVVFIIENNGFSIATSEARSSATGGSLAQRAEAYGMPWERLNGDSIYEIRAKMGPVMERARREHQPAVIEISTYRFEGFIVSDANKFVYRQREEVERRKEHHDPIKRWATVLQCEGVATASELKSIDRDATDEARDACTFAKPSPFPEPKSIFEDIYWEVDHAKKDGPCGRHFF